MGLDNSWQVLGLRFEPEYLVFEAQLVLLCQQDYPLKGSHLLLRAVLAQWDVRFQVEGWGAWAASIRDGCFL